MKHEKDMHTLVLKVVENTHVLHNALCCIKTYFLYNIHRDVLDQRFFYRKKKSSAMHKEGHFIGKGGQLI